MRIGLNRAQKLLGFIVNMFFLNKPTLKTSIDDINKTFKSLNIKMK